MEMRINVGQAMKPTICVNASLFKSMQAGVSNTMFRNDLGMFISSIQLDWPLIVCITRRYTSMSEIAATPRTKVVLSYQ